jgi:VWFA-related protein
MLMASLSNPRSQQQNQQDDPIKLSADLVLIDAQVLIKKTGHALQGLTRDDFVLYEDNVRQYITHFSQDKLPLSIVILLDVSSSIAPMFDGLRSAAMQSLQRLKPVDRVALMAFGGSTKVTQGFTSNTEEVADKILETDGTGLERGTVINEGILQAAAYLKRNSDPLSRRVILAITDDVSTQKSLTPSESSTLKSLNESGAVVWGLIFFNPLRNTMIRLSAGSVRNYANETGGIIIHADKKRLGAALDKLIERVRSRYSIGFISTNEKRKGGFRKVRLELSPQAQQRVEKAEIVARKGYSIEGNEK